VNFGAGEGRSAGSAGPLAPPRIADVARRFARDRAALGGAVLVGLLALAAIVGPWVLPWDPLASDFSLARGPLGPPGPSSAHWLGTDPLFRDLAARLCAGARISLLVAVVATAMATALGALVGVTSGLAAGTRAAALDVVLMRLVDALLALPFLLVVSAIGVAVGRADVGTLLLVLGLTGWTGTARLVRARTLAIRELDFVTAALALGAGRARVVLRHVLPNVTGTLIVVATTSVAQMILAEAVLGYLTLGVQPPRPTWGRMLHESEHYLGTRPFLVAAPGFAVLLAALAFTRVGEGLRDALDPRSAATRRGRVPWDFVAVLAVMALAAVGAPTAVRPAREAGSATSPLRGGVLHLATTVTLRTLDPALAYDEASAAVEQLVFARLVKFDRAGAVVPDLAEAVSTSADGRTVTFRLREGARFHDGSPVSAADAKRSIERALDPRTPCPASSHFAMIEGFAAFHGGKAPHLEGVRVLDDRTLAVDLHAPDATFLPLMTLAFAAPVCASAGPFASAKKPAPPCGAGPFRVTSFDPDHGVRLARHEGYFLPGRPYLDGVEWQTGVRAATQRYKLEDGAIDHARDLTAADAALFRASPSWATSHRFVDRQSVQAVFLNTELAPFDRREVRRAVALALDPSVLEKVRADVRAVDRVLPPSLPGPGRGAPMRVHDHAAALAAMERAGLAFDPRTGRGGWPAPIPFVTFPDSFEQQAAEVFQQQLARVGLRVELRLVTFATYLAEVSRRRTAPMGTVGWNADYPDASNFFEPTLSSAAIEDEGSQNYAFFSDARFDAVLARARAERDVAARSAAYAEAEAIVRDEAPWVPAYTVRAFEIWQPYLRGYEPHPVLGLDFGDAWLDPAGARDGAVARARAAVGSPLAGLAVPRGGRARTEAR
jgi:ABC-type dipeptide/oligopeptide/nickel transport system permease subunit/ABC-type transport system substrate-binding protein